MTGESTGQGCKREPISLNDADLYHLLKGGQLNTQKAKIIIADLGFERIRQLVRDAEISVAEGNNNCNRVRQK